MLIVSMNYIFYVLSFIRIRSFFQYLTNTQVISVNLPEYLSATSSINKTTLRHGFFQPFFSQRNYPKQSAE